ncbi:hypothetical protein AGR7B_pAt0280 [Agrobacterium deltaense RV3]|nr:hypothetical protein AGR7B_pAt0280 [Agrobacterium deltaense RV3]
MAVVDRVHSEVLVLAHPTVVAEVVLVVPRNNEDAILSAQPGQRRYIYLASLKIAVDQVASNDDQVRVLGVSKVHGLANPIGLEKAADVQVGELDDTISFEFSRQVRDRKRDLLHRRHSDCLRHA